jgi:hypothetical protein
LYNQKYWNPDATVAAGLPIQVFPDNNNVFQPLFADAAGTIPLANPGLLTDLFGFATFYAAPGRYWLHLDTQTYLIDVGPTAETVGLSTGVAAGADLSPSLVNPQAIDLAPFIGYIVNSTNALVTPLTVVTVNYPGGTVPLLGASLTRSITYWLMDASLNVIQQGTYPTPVQFRQLIVLGLTVYDIGAGMIIEAQTIPTILGQPDAQFVDLTDSLGPFSLSGNEITANGPNLMLNKSAGTLFARAFNYISGAVATDNPHITTSPALTALSFRRIAQLAMILTPPAVTTVDPGNYDVGGVVTPVPGGPNTSTIQRIYLFGANTASLRVAIQYGQIAYATPALAVSSIGSGTKFTPAPVARIGALIGYLAVTKSATDLSNSAQATFVYAGKFSTP